MVVGITSVMFENKYLFQIINFNYEIIDEEFENDKIWVVILKFSILTIKFKNF